MSKVLIINQHTLNFGDDIAGISLIQNLLKEKNIESIDIIYNTKGKLLIEDEKIRHNQDIMLKNIGYANLIKYFLFRKLGWKNFKNEPLKKMIDIINISDFIFVSPCGANIGIYKDWRFLIKLLIVITENKTPIFHLNTIGSSNSKLFDFFSKKVLKKSIIYVREKKSLEYIESLGLNAKFGVDTAFSFEDDSNIDRKNKIAFVPTILKNWHPNFKNIDIDELVFEKILPIIAEFSKERDLLVELIPHLKNEEEDEYYKKIISKFDELSTKVLYRKDINTVYEYNSAIKESQLVIGMRYHSIVLAVKNMIPFISLSYENKMQEVASYSEMPEYAFKLYEKDFDLVKLKEKLNEAFEKNTEISKTLEKVLYSKLIKLSRLPLEQLKSKKDGEKNEK